MSSVNKFVDLLKKVWFPVFVLSVILIWYFWNKLIGIILLAVMIAILTLQIVYELVKTRSFRNYLTKFHR
ncbi:MAG: hypothetical protein GF364_18110, partial [Candidatus Lokiarchaeota archaeon]|nr:hypothetical protein [Candidatus Lokiarchaeota archaeon]